MNKLMGSVLLLSAVTCNAAFVPVSVTRQIIAQPVDVRSQVATAINAAALAGKHYAVVNVDDTSFKEDKVIMKELQAQGYNVSFCEAHHIYGWNNLNGGLLIKW